MLHAPRVQCKLGSDRPTDRISSTFISIFALLWLEIIITAKEKKYGKWSCTKQTFCLVNSRTFALLLALARTTLYTFCTATWYSLARNINEEQKNHTENIYWESFLFRSFFLVISSEVINSKSGNLRTRTGHTTFSACLVFVCLSIG